MKIKKQQGGYKHLFKSTRFEDLVKVILQVSVAYLMCSPLQVLMKSWTWEKRVSKSGMFGMENFTNLEEKCNKVAKVKSKARFKAQTQDFTNVPT